MHAEEAVPHRVGSKERTLALGRTIPQHSSIRHYVCFCSTTTNCSGRIICCRIISCIDTFSSQHTNYSLYHKS